MTDPKEEGFLSYGYRFTARTLMRTVCLMQPQLFQVDLACTEEVGVIQVRYAAPERTRKSMQRMEVSIVESVIGCNTEDKDENR